ncbi:hypothetical protein Q3G72_019841 [Acer saccharum]|nr:hypothetical protein Q3G72_019841 [Acer saccharum]
MKFSPAFPPTIPPPTTTTSPDFVDVLEFSECLYQTAVPAQLTMTAYPAEDIAPRKMPRLSASEELQLPPGYRFVPSDSELIVDYLMKKLMNRRLLPNIIIDTNIYKYNPWDLAGMHESQGSNQWYFFTSRDRKYPKGIRPNRAAGDGYWKATGAEKKIYNDNHKVVGTKNSLVFCKGKPPKGDKTPWLMHEYLVHSATQSKCNATSSSNNMRLNDWVLCKIYKKPTKSNVNHYKNNSGRNVECTSPLSRDSSAPLFHSPDIPDNRVDDSVAIQPVYTTATNGITYSGLEMIDPPLGFEDVNVWNMPEMVDAPLGFEDDDKWNISDLCIEDCNHQSMGTLEDIVTPPTNLLKKRRKETLRVG